MLIKPNKSVLKIKDEFEKIKEQIVSNLDERYERLVNKEVYEENLNALNNLKKPYDKLYKKYDELERQRNSYLYGLLVSVIGLFFLYDLMTGQKIISDFDTFWYWVLAIFLTISGVAGMPLIYKQNQKLTSEAYDKYIVIETQYKALEATCKKEIEPFFDNYTINDVYRLIENIEYDMFIYPQMSHLTLGQLKELVGYPDQVNDNQTVKDLFFGRYKSNPFLIYDLITCEITDLEFSNTKAVSWDTKDVKETSDAKITTTTTHKQTLRASIVTKGPSYFTKRVFELWNTNMPELNFKLTTRYSPKDNDLMRRIQSDIWHLRVTKQPIDKVFKKLFFVTTDQMQLFNQAFTDEVKLAYVTYAMYNHQFLNSHFTINKSGYKYTVELNTLNQFKRFSEKSLESIYNIDYHIYKKDYLKYIGGTIEFIFYLLKPFSALPLVHTTTFKDYKPSKLPNQYVSNLQHQSMLHEMKVSNLISATVDHVIYKTKVLGTFDMMDYVEVDAHYWLYQMKSDQVKVQDNNYRSHWISVNYKEYYEQSQRFNIHVKPCPHYFKYAHFNKLVHEHPEKDKINDYLSNSLFTDNTIIFKYPTTILKADNDLLNTLIFYEEDLNT